MKDERKKYIIVNAQDINITLRERVRVSGFNDFWNEYQAVGETTAKAIFEQHQIPEQFQKIAFALPTCRCCHANGQEVLTGRTFEIQKDNKSKEFFGYESGRWFAGDVIGGSLRFKTPKQKEKYASVVSFYEQLTESGYLEQYIDAIKSIFFLEHELQVNGEPTKVEDKASSLLKTYFIKQLTK